MMAALDIGAMFAPGNLAEAPLLAMAAAGG
jgi:hypothetical protein